MAVPLDACESQREDIARKFLQTVLPERVGQQLGNDAAELCFGQKV